MADCLEYENLDVIYGLIDELKHLLKSETTLKNSINNSVDVLNDYNILQNIKTILKEKNCQDLELSLEDQKGVDTLLIPANVLEGMKLNYPCIFQELGIDDAVTDFTVGEQNKMLKALLEKITNENDSLIRHLQTDQINGTLAVVNKFKLVINNQLECTLEKLFQVYEKELFPLEESHNMYRDVAGINSLTKLKGFYGILKQIEMELSRAG